MYDAIGRQKMHIKIGTRTTLARTCNRCHEFKQADEFYFRKLGYLESYCKVCRRQLSDEGKQQKQREAVCGAVRAREHWTVQEIRIFKEMLSDGRTAAQMAYRLDRTLYAIYGAKHRFKKEGIL